MVGKIAFLVTVVIDGPAQILIFPMRWLVAATIISSQGFSCVDSSSRGRALRPRAARAIIATISIAPTLLVVPARSLGLGGLGAIRRHGSCLLKTKQKGILVPGMILGRF